MDPTATSNVFYYATQSKAEKKLKSLGLKPLNEGVILGITAALLVNAEKQPLSCLFAETHSSLPDSKAAAQIIESLDKYLRLKVDSKPLLKMADKFEQKIKSMLQQGQVAQQEKEKKEMSYVG